MEERNKVREKLVQAKTGKPTATNKEETEEERAHRAELRRRADLIKKLRAEAKELRDRLNELRGIGPDGKGRKRPEDPIKLKEFEEKLPLYQELKQRLQSFDW